MDSNQAIASIDKATIRQTLLYETLKLFALMANADGVVSKEEEQYVDQHIQSLYPPDIAPLFFKEFTLTLEENPNLDSVIANINGRFQYYEKIFSVAEF